MRNLRRNGRSLRGSKSKSRPSQCFSPPQYRRDKKFHTGPPTLLSRAGIDELVSSVCITRSLLATLPGKPISFDRPAGGKRGVSLDRFERRDEDKGTLSLLFVTSYTMSYNSSQLSRRNRSWKLEKRGQLIYCHISILKLGRGEGTTIPYMIERHRSTGIAFADPDSWISIITSKLPSRKPSRFISRNRFSFATFHHSGRMDEASSKSSKIFNSNPKTFHSFLQVVYYRINFNHVKMSKRKRYPKSQESRPNK